MKNKLVGVILIGILILSACSYSNTKETEQNSVAASSEKSSEVLISTDQVPEDEFVAKMPVHAGIWQAADYGRTNYYYEFSKGYTGRRLGANAGDIEEFSYPRNRPEYVEIGHNGIREKYKRQGYGHTQLEEAIRRIREYEGLKRIIVCTNNNLAAPKNYESVGFSLYDRKSNETESAYTGDYLYYEILL